MVDQLIEYYAAINTMIIMIMSQNGKYNTTILNITSRIKNHAGYSLCFCMTKDWASENSGLYMSLFKVSFKCHSYT